MDATPTPDPHLTANEIARRLNVSTKTVRRWAKQGKLPPGIKLGHLRRWRRSDLSHLF